MKTSRASLSDVFSLSPDVYSDRRGFFFEAFNNNHVNSETGLNFEVVQVNQSFSRSGVLRGLHYQTGAHAQSKFIRPLEGKIQDVVVDMRKYSRDFGRWKSVNLAHARQDMLFVPKGFAHGFLVESEHAVVEYLVDEPYSPENEVCLLWNDPAIGIKWSCQSAPVMSTKDQSGRLFSQCPFFID